MFLKYMIFLYKLNILTRHCFVKIKLTNEIVFMNLKTIDCTLNLINKNAVEKKNEFKLK